MKKFVTALALSVTELLASSAYAAAFLPYQTTAPAQVTAGAGWSVKPLVTIGETLPNAYRPVGILDGIGAFRLDSGTVRVFVNHEIGGTQGYAYTVSNGAGGTTSLTGARVSFFDIDIATRNVVDAGQAYSRIFDRAGNIVTAAGQIGTGGFSRFCSSSLFEANAFGANRGIADRIYFTGEETSGGSAYALNPASGELHAVPMFGRAAFENVTQIDTGTTNKVAFIISDDTAGSGADSGSPMYLYVGTKGGKGDNSFLDRNGLASGKFYVWKADSAGTTNPSNFNGNGSTAAGSWVEITNFDASKAGQAGYDSLGYATAATLRAQATAVGAFRFSRPEDVDTNPADGTLIALASTGSGQFGGADSWGTIYTLKTTFDVGGNPISANVRVVYDGNADPARRIRSPDNLDWASATELLINEDKSSDWASAVGANPNEAGILKLSLNGTISTVARVNRLGLPVGQADSAPNDLGNWETSGVLDVSALFGVAQGTLFLSDTQAHSLTNGSIGGATNLVEGGQLFFLTAVPEPSTWAMMIGGFALIGGLLRRRPVTVRTMLAG